MLFLMAAAIAAQFHSGVELEAACRAPDTTACDAYLSALASTSPSTACIVLEEKGAIEKLRIELLRALDEKRVPLNWSAVDVAVTALEPLCDGAQ